MITSDEATLWIWEKTSMLCDGWVYRYLRTQMAMAALVFDHRAPVSCLEGIYTVARQVDFLYIAIDVVPR